ncbi:MAG: type VI secretion system membrane subunit TssM [Rhizobiaceae bacterium]|nr:type VI secretion system membrane subunit TssM [Rhizobiaceae bacterium]
MLNWLLRLVSLAALAGFSAAVWYAGPLIAYDEARPLEGEAVRIAVIAGALGLFAVYYGFRFWQVRRAERALEEAMARASDEESDAAVLKERMAAAVATLKRKRGRGFLQEQPWYVITGPPGAGKTTALVNSGLDFPLAGSDAAQPVAGVGGTRFCDWWFTDDGVLIDTAGRYTTLESDAARDRKSWLAFLSALKKHRPLQPLNGVILAISLHDLMTLDGHALGVHTAEIRNRLDEIADTLKIDFPVYVLFTKADLVSGFMELFGDLDENGRKAVWGETFQTDDRTRNMVEQSAASFDALADRVAERVTDRLAGTVDRQARAAVFAFPAQFGALKDKTVNFLRQVFDPARPSGAILRGFYFTSGTQEGSPIDQFLGTAGRAFGTTAPLSGKGRSFFLHDLLKKVVFAESGWVSYDRAIARRAALLRFAGLGAVSLAVVAALGAMALALLREQARTADIRAALDSYRTDAPPAVAEATVTQPDLENVIEPLDLIGELPVAGEPGLSARPGEALGLDPGRRLQSARGIAYRRGLERYFRPRLLLELEQAITAGAADPAGLYEPLKAYLMLTGAAPRIDNDFIVSWFTRDWEDRLYPGPQNQQGRARLERHLRAMLDVDDAYDPLYPPDRRLVEAAQRALGTLPLADRATAIVGSAHHAASAHDYALASGGGAQAQLVFDTTDASSLSSVSVPGFYTARGFNEVFLPALSEIARRLVDDQWVLGPGGALPDLERDLPKLGPELLNRYGKDFVDAWTGAIERLKFRSLADDAPQYPALAALAAPDSPLVGVLQGIAGQTALTQAAGDDTRLAAGLARIGLVLSGGKSQARAGTAPSAAGMPAGAAIAAQFRPFQSVVDGRPGERPIDTLVQNFRDIYRSLLIADAAAQRSDRADSNFVLQISSLRNNASRLPKVFAGMVRAAADEFEGEAAETSIAQINAALKETVTGACQEVIANRYPFNPGASEEVPLDAFARLFGPGGTIDRFFAQNLSSLVEFSEPEWRWKQDGRIGRELSPAALRPFQQAAQLRDAFFPERTALPAVALTVTPVSLHNDADLAFLEINGQVVQSYQTGNAPMVVNWPGDSPAASASLAIMPELQGRESRRRFTGQWAAKRLFDTASSEQAADATHLRFILGGRDVAYALQAGQVGNPFGLAAFSGFVCPDSL